MSGAIPMAMMTGARMSGSFAIEGEFAGKPTIVERMFTFLPGYSCLA
jgi:hypothetical protein